MIRPNLTVRVVFIHLRPETTLQVRLLVRRPLLALKRGCMTGGRPCEAG